MKKSSFIHIISIIAGIAGFVALLGAWVAGKNNGTILGVSQLSAVWNALLLEVISISAGVCAIYRRQVENEGQK